MFPSLFNAKVFFIWQYIKEYFVQFFKLKLFPSLEKHVHCMYYTTSGISFSLGVGYTTFDNGFTFSSYGFAPIGIF